MWRPSPYRAVNTFHLGYKNQSVYAVSGTIRCLFSDKYKTHKYCVGRAYSCWMLNWWCVTWPVGFRRLLLGIILAHFIFDYKTYNTRKLEQYRVFTKVGLATRYDLDVSGIESWCGGEILPTRPEALCGRLSFLYYGYPAIAGGKTAEAWRWPPTPI